MDEPSETPAGPRRRRLLRAAVLVLGAAETAAMALPVAELLSSPEGLSRSIGEALLAIVAVVFVLFVLPALVLGLLGRGLWVALALEVLAVPAYWLVMHVLAG